MTFGGVAATGVTFVDATQLNVTSPAGTGLVDVVVTNPDTQFATLTNGYTYASAPLLNSITRTWVV